MAAVTLAEFLENWAKGRPALLERLATGNGFIPPKVFEAEAERVADRQKAIQKPNKKGWTDTEIAEFVELDLKTVQTYIALSV